MRSPYRQLRGGSIDQAGRSRRALASRRDERPEALLPHIQAGKLKALAVISNARWAELPDVPTFAEMGLTGFPPELWFGLPAPAGTRRRDRQAQTPPSTRA